MHGPAPAPSGIRCYAFASFVLDIHRRQLWRDRRRVPLSAKTFDVLLLLIVNRDHVVTKDDFFAQVWPDAVVLEANLVRQISMLRRALEERLEDHEFIVTIPGRGYQFVADVIELPALPDELPERTPMLPRSVEPDPQQDAEALRFHVEKEPSGDSGSPGAVELMPPGTSEPKPSRRQWLLVSAAMIVIAGIPLAWRLFAPDRMSLHGPTLRQLTFDAAFAREPSWSPDGQFIAYTSDKSGNADIWVQSVNDPTPRQVTTALAQDWQPHWSPTSDQIVFRSETEGGGLFIVSARGGTPTRLTDFGSTPKWSPDGTRILFSDANVRFGARRLFVIAGSGGMPTEVETTSMERFRSASMFASVHAAWDPDGRISIWGWLQESGWTFVTVDITTRTERVSVIRASVRDSIERLALRLGNFVWSHSGRDLYFEGRIGQTRTLWRVGIDPKTKEWISGPERLSIGTTDDIDLALSPDGTRLAFTAQSTQTRVWQLPLDREGAHLAGVPQPVTPGNAGELGVDISQDGRQLAYRALRGEREEIWAYSLDDHRERLLLASTTTRRTSPLWSPDGTRLIYTRHPSAARSTADYSLVILPARGGDEHEVETPRETYIQPRDWSQDGGTIVGNCGGDAAGPLGTCLVSFSEGRRAEVKLIAHDPSMNMFCQSFSPNQQWVSFLAVSAANPRLSRVHIVPVAGGPLTAVTDGLSYEDKPRWAPDGRTLYYLSDRSGSLNVWGRHIDPATGTPLGAAFQVTSYNSRRFRLSPQLTQMEMAISRDRLFLPISESTGAIWTLDDLQPPATR